MNHDVAIVDGNEYNKNIRFLFSLNFDLGAAFGSVREFPT